MYSEALGAGSQKQLPRYNHDSLGMSLYYASIFFRKEEFKPSPHVQKILEFLIGKCAKRYPVETCPLCGKVTLPDDPKVSKRLWKSLCRMVQLSFILLFKS